MAESKSAKDRRSEDDVKFNRDELLDDDLEVSEEARIKRIPAAPEEIQENLDKVTWPVPSDRLPAVMVADKNSDHEYQRETMKEIDEEHREAELRSGPGTVARAELGKSLAKAAKKGGDMNEVIAPPSVNAQLAADGQGAPNEPIPVVRREGTEGATDTPRRATAPAPQRRDNK